LAFTQKHVLLLTTLKPGELRVVKDGCETSMAIGEGFVEIRADAVSVLTDMAWNRRRLMSQRRKPPSSVLRLR